MDEKPVNSPIAIAEWVKKNERPGDSGRRYDCGHIVFQRETSGR